MSAPDLAAHSLGLGCAWNRHQLLCVNCFSVLDTTFLSWIMLAVDDTPWTQRFTHAARASLDDFSLADPPREIGGL
jgi:hypothetical protein